MMNKKKSNEILLHLKEVIQNPKCELDFFDNFSLICAVMLSAQTTDKRVNEVTKILFSKYSNCMSLSKASFNDVYSIIKPLGLAQTKTNNLISLATIIYKQYNGVVPNNFDELVKLPGIGRKTANVVLALGFNIPAFPVDTHVFRVSKRLGYISLSDDVYECERILKKYISKDEWIDTHHLFLLFGRYFCKATNPSCDSCNLSNYCVKTKNDKS